MTAWIKAQWSHKGFRILMAATLALTLLMCVEFTLFEYGLLKVLRYYIMLWALTLLAWIDGQSRRIPNRFLLLLFGTRIFLLLLECLFYREYWRSMLLSAGSGFLAGGGLFLVCFLVSRGGIGAGDVKLMAVLGFYMGSAIYTVIFLVVLSSACFSAVALLLKKISLRQEIPFAPFVLTGTVLAMIAGV